MNGPEAIVLIVGILILALFCRGIIKAFLAGIETDAVVYSGRSLMEGTAKMNRQYRKLKEKHPEIRSIKDILDELNGEEI